MKTRKLYAIVSVLAICAFAFVFMGCPDRDDEGSGGNPTSTFTSIGDFAEYLFSQPANTATTPYHIKLKVSDLGGNSSTPGSVGAVLLANPTKYVYLDLPYSITSIESSAFSGCTSLTSITIPNIVTSIESSAFSGCTSLTAITIPDSVTNIELNAFNGTPWFDNLYQNQPDGVVYAGKVAYFYKGTMPENTSITLLDGTTGIADGAFLRDNFDSYPYYSNLISITIPDSVKSIGDVAFYNCDRLTSVTIPDTLILTRYYKNITLLKPCQLLFLKYLIFFLFFYILIKHNLYFKYFTQFLARKIRGFYRYNRL